MELKAAQPLWESNHSEVTIAFQNHSYPPVPS